ncbi:hypothetical protein [Paucibacter soli]|uniref:hypothetical protein n=1 Tax=Paucibacter soli TaxID=3133433 RepID=UPI0030B4A424
MSKRRSVGDVVQLDDEDGTAPYLVRIDAQGAERGDRCPHAALDSHHDQQCAEWPVVVVLDEQKQATRERVFHVPECQMADPA